jgi:hypothetical protein
MELQVMVRYQGVWMSIRLPESDLIDRVRWGLWSSTQGERYTDGFPSYESMVEMNGIAHERSLVCDGTRDGY